MNSRVKTALARMQAQAFPADLPPAGELEASSPRRRDSYTVPVSTPVPTARRVIPRRGILVGGLGVAVAAAATIAVPSLLGGNAAAYAATPAMLTYAPATGTAKDLLLNLAEHARGQQAQPPIGPYHYMQRRGWYLSVAGDTEGRILGSGITEITREQWIAPDGSGRIISSSDGRTAPWDQNFGPGGLFAGFIAENGASGAIHASDQEDKSTVGVLRAVADLWKRQVLSPRQQADILMILANQSGLSVLGNTTDRAGRAGVAIGAEHHEGAGERLVMVFAPDTGALLDVESIVLEDSDLPVRAPATVEYTVWLTSGHTRSVESRP